MKVLARALVDALAFLHFTGEGDPGRDRAEELMDLIASHLQECTPDERQAVLEVVREQYRLQNEALAPEEVIDFYENFDETFLGGDERE